jgi:hypothetical protein
MMLIISLGVILFDHHLVTGWNYYIMTTQQ